MVGIYKTEVGIFVAGLEVFRAWLWSAGSRQHASGN